MANNPKYYIIESSALPEVFLKVAEAKRLLDTGRSLHRQRCHPSVGHQSQRLLQVSGFHSSVSEPDGRPDHHISADPPR